MPRLRHIAVDTCVGPLIVASGEKGIQEVRLGDSIPVLLAEFETSCPESRPDMSLTDVASSIGSTVLGGVPPAVPLDLRGTPFQMRVWDGIRQIPRGRTCTYAELARYIGLPTAVRAVASACAANRIAILVPCHRVVRTDGSIGMYRWGTERKGVLLGIESGELSRNGTRFLKS